MDKILVVEDDKTIRECIREVLIEKGYIVELAEDGAEAVEKIRRQLPDLVVLDLGLPKLGGESVLAEIKKTSSQIQVIILTAKNNTSDIVKGFEMGADDYISKPFELEELVARIKVKLKNGNGKLQVDGLVLDDVSVSVSRDGKVINLSPHEFKLLKYMMINKGRVLSRDMILNRVWQYSYDVDSRVVDVFIGYLRKKIDSGYKKKLISSVRGFGYVVKE